MVYIRPPRLYGEGDGEASGNPHCCRAIRIEETGIDHVKWLFGMQTVCQRQHGARDACGMKASTQCRNDRRSEEHTSELQSLMRTTYDVFLLKKHNTYNK